jgi:hypothetical protein
LTNRDAFIVEMVTCNVIAKDEGSGSVPEKGKYLGRGSPRAR